MPPTNARAGEVENDGYETDPLDVLEGPSTPRWQSLMPEKSSKKVEKPQRP
jgi:hypothetical protein